MDSSRTTKMPRKQPTPMSDTSDSEQDTSPTRKYRRSERRGLRPPGAQSRATASIVTPSMFVLLVGVLLAILFGSFLSTRILSVLMKTLRTERPSALSPPSPPPGLSPPSHYTFTTLPTISDFVAISRATIRVTAKLSSSPAFDNSVRCKVDIAGQNLQNALSAMNGPYGRHPGPQVEFIPDGERLRRTYHDVITQSWEVYRLLSKVSMLGSVHWQPRVENMMERVIWQVKQLTEEKVWAIHPDEVEDQGQYDDFELVGDINFQEAAVLNRSAYAFLASFESEYLPVLLKLADPEDPGMGPRQQLEKRKAMVGEAIEALEKFSRTNWVAETGISADEDALLNLANPSPLRRALFWAGRLDAWKYPCSHSFFPGKQIQSRDDYYFATRWRCVVIARRALETDALPLLYQSRKDVDEALAIYDSAIAAAGKKLQAQLGELLAGRGWESVEPAQIALTAGGHWAEVQQPREAGRSSRWADLGSRERKEVTLWRRMVLPLAWDVAELLEKVRDAMI